MSRKDRSEVWRDEDGLLRIEGWAREGMTDARLAERMGVGASTLRRWKKRFTEIAEAMSKGRAPVDVQAENALLKAALGYTVKVKKPFKVKRVTTRPGEGRVEEERIEYAEEEIHVPPKSNVLLFVNKNLRPDRWRDRPGADDAGGDEVLEEVLRKWDGESEE